MEARRVDARRTQQEKTVMIYSDVTQYKPLVECNPYERYYRKIVKVYLVGAKRGIRGEVVSVTDKRLTLEHLDGRRTIILLSEIGAISEVPHKAPNVEVV